MSLRDTLKYFVHLQNEILKLKMIIYIIYVKILCSKFEKTCTEGINNVLNHIALKCVTMGNNFLMWVHFKVYCFTTRKPRKEEFESEDKSLKCNIKGTFPERNCDIEII